MTIKKLMLAAAIAVPALLSAAPVMAQAGGVATFDQQAAIANSKAFTAARTQVETQYKTQLDQAEARRRAINTELQPLVTAYQNAAKAPGATEASLRPQATAIQTRETAANQELSRLTAPAQRAQAYAVEQIQAQLPTAVQNAVRARNVTMLVTPQAVIFAQPTADITTAVTAELDRLVPSVSATPPANWQPGQQAAAPTAATTAPATAPARGRTQSQGR